MYNFSYGSKGSSPKAPTSSGSEQCVSWKRLNISCCICYAIELAAVQCVIHSARFRGWAVISCWGGDRRTGEAREASSPPNSRQHVSAISPGREINDVFFASLLNILVSLPSLSYCDLLFFFPIREVCLKSSSSSSVLFSGVHGFLYTFLLLSLLRPTSYAQKL